MTRPERLFPHLSDDIEYLIGRDVEPDGWECDKCGCPIARFFLAKPGELGLRCPDVRCGAIDTNIRGVPRRFSVGADRQELEWVAQQDRWSCAMHAMERRLGSWWDWAIHSYWRADTEQ